MNKEIQERVNKGEMLPLMEEFTLFKVKATIKELQLILLELEDVMLDVIGAM